MWLSDKQIEIISRLAKTIQRDGGILLLTGDIGMGKTTFINYLVNVLSSDIAAIKISFPDLDENSLFEFMHGEFKFHGFYQSKGAFLFHLDQHLRELSAQGKCVLIMIDDAQAMSPETIQALQLLTKIKIDQKKIIRVLLVAQNIDGFISKSENDFDQKITFNRQLEALTLSETHQYINHRLKRAGAANRIFEPEAIDLVFSVSAGCPRVINAICDNMLLSGYAEGVFKLSKNHGQDSAKELGLI
jgi:type II secretory pathway predicted ATPase ExeA